MPRAKSLAMLFAIRLILSVALTVLAITTNTASAQSLSEPTEVDDLTEIDESSGTEGALQPSSEACRVAVETFPINPSICADELNATTNPALQAELGSYLAIGYARTNQPTDARAAIEQAINTGPEYWLVHANHGVMLLYLNDFRSSFEATNRALGLTQQPIPDLYLNLALAARGAGEFATSENAYRTYLDLMGFPQESLTDSPDLDVHGPPQRGDLQQRFSGDPFKATRRIQPR